MPKRVKSETHMEQKLRYNARARKFAWNGHIPWRKGDIEQVLAHNIPDSLLAGRLGRSIQAVQAKRNRELMKGGIFV